MGFPRNEYWNGLPFPPPGDLPEMGPVHRTRRPSWPMRPGWQRLRTLQSGEAGHLLRGALWLRSKRRVDPLRVFHLVETWNLTRYVTVGSWNFTLPHVLDIGYEFFFMLSITKHSCPFIQPLLYWMKWRDMSSDLDQSCPSNCDYLSCMFII